MEVKQKGGWCSRSGQTTFSGESEKRRKSLLAINKEVTLLKQKFFHKI
jgi:hypothetical protein